MMKTGESSLFPLLYDYLKTYLPKQRNVSHNTILSYRKALEELLDYVKEREQIPLGSLSFEHLTADVIFSFLEHLELEKGCSISTRNARFAAIRAFMDYAADHDITLIANLNKLWKVPVDTPGNPPTVDYKSFSEINEVLQQPDSIPPKGLRGRFMIMVLYDTVARGREVLN